MNVIVPPTYRDRYVAAVIALLGKPVLWSAKGPLAYDCSGSVTAPIKSIGGRDITLIDNAQALHNETRPLVPGRELLLSGDLVFYGTSPLGIEHVASYVIDEDGPCVISADGATSHLDPRLIGFDKALELAMANPANRVRRHPAIDFRKDLPFHVVHRNTFVDELDLVSR